MRVHLYLDGVSTEQLRVISRTCAQHREHFPTYNNMTTHGAQSWEPIVHAQGLEQWAVTVPACPTPVALEIMRAVDMLAPAQVTD